MDFQKCFITGCYTGLLPKAPGTWGSIFGAILAFLILQILPQSSLFLLAILVTIVAIKEINKYERKTNTHDDKKIVIDEIVGIWIAISILPSISIFWIVIAFFLFRFFDITKISYIGKLEKNLKGAIAVMADDILAGILSGLLTGIFYVISKKFILI
ncbi:phosphatidylglycerophosphatase A family protein [Nitrosophilus kaiyonis]|uniref:phosphatidylglycerophosphatase A family protein n=1 Tax=Nitrosophilus kaiyonis TaxID=2930200 RepID=UPI0024926609|nr:phosphatidylglycerophosphatase A [Nitrosophilus kaiyonis]